MGHESAQSLWSAIQERFGIQSRVEEDYLCQVFQFTRKGLMKMNDYLRVMKNHADNLELAGSPIPQHSLVSQVLIGLDGEYNPIVATI